MLNSRTLSASDFWASYDTEVNSLNLRERRGFEPWVGYKPTMVYKAVCDRTETV